VDETYKINKGLRITRQLYLDITSRGLPIAVELLDTSTCNTLPPTLADDSQSPLSSWPTPSAGLLVGLFCLDRVEAEARAHSRSTNDRVSATSRASIRVDLPHRFQKRHRRKRVHRHRCHARGRRTACLPRIGFYRSSRHCQDSGQCAHPHHSAWRFVRTQLLG
jgi:hypothetical protein